MKPHYSLNRTPGYRFEGDRLKEHIFPHLLFRYMAFSDLALSTIAENYLWFSNADDLNDPFEVSDIFQKDFSNEEIENFLQHNFTRMLAKAPEGSEARSTIEKMISNAIEMNETQKRFLQNAMQMYMKHIHEHKVDQASICCFSVDSTVPLLWSHYANGHKGLCVVYDSTKLVNEKTQLLEVEYAGEPKIFPYMQRRQQYTDSARFQLEFSQAVFGQKSKDWAYEQEFRLLSHSSGRNDIPSNAIVGVVLGAKMSDVEKSKVVDLAVSRDADLPVFHAKLDTSKRSIIGYPFKNQLVHANVNDFVLM